MTKPMVPVSGSGMGDVELLPFRPDKFEPKREAWGDLLRSRRQWDDVERLRIVKEMLEVEILKEALERACPKATLLVHSPRPRTIR